MTAGITGHRSLGNEKKWKWVRSTIWETVSNLTIDLGFTSLAIGADQIFADTLIKKQIPYKVIIPCEHYEETFESMKEQMRYNGYINQADYVIILNYPAPSEIAFFEAGKTIVKYADILIAVWDGKPAKGLGGTADIVNLAIKQNKKYIWINPLNKKTTYRLDI